MRARLPVPLLLVGALTLGGAAACDGGSSAGDGSHSDAASDAVPPDASPEADASEPEPAGPPGRVVHRMTVEQLARTIPTVTGGISWTEDFGQGPQDMLEILSGTLGAPDYVRVTDESLEPSLIIAKFMQDAGRRVCAKWLARDRDLPSADRTLIAHDDWDSVDEADVKRSLRYLQLRFFSRHVPPDEDAPIADLYELFSAASSAAPPGKAADDGWLAVCIAMMSDPEFILY